MRHLFVPFERNTVEGELEHFRAEKANHWATLLHIGTPVDQVFLDIQRYIGDLGADDFALQYAAAVAVQIERGNGTATIYHKLRPMWDAIDNRFRRHDGYFNPLSVGTAQGAERQMLLQGRRGDLEQRVFNVQPPAQEGGPLPLDYD